MRNSQYAPNFLLSCKERNAGLGRKEQKDSTKVFAATLIDLYCLHALDCLNLLHGPGYREGHNALTLYLQASQAESHRLGHEPQKQPYRYFHAASPGEHLGA